MHMCVKSLSPWQRRGPMENFASDPVLLVSPTTTLLTGRWSLKSK